MAIIKCKMCGGDIALSEDKTTGTCEYCGSLMTLPKVSDEQRLNLFNRANHFRRQGEFDRAISAYEKILEQDDADAEAHWGAVLSRYGIEYVEDPSSGERIPTCHRVQPTSILTDGDYEAALRYAPDGASRALYESEAHRIAEIQRDILAISAREKPYDVFICYKESDDAGSRTVDSTLAQEIYYQLTGEGYKVFFARITLEDKLGREYEPYIFAALNSAKVMLVVGTKPEHFNAVWVKNEWSRYLDLMKKDRSRLLIPCYRDMDPYDLPDALSSLQSQDMAKIGFIQDLIRGVKKVLDAGKQATPATTAEAAVEAAAPGVASLCRRAELFLENADWERANEYAERALDIDPEYAPAYMIKVCTAMKVARESDLAELDCLFGDNADYKLALRFASEERRQVYADYHQQAVLRTKQREKEKAEREDRAARERSVRRDLDEKYMFPIEKSEHELDKSNEKIREMKKGIEALRKEREKHEETRQKMLERIAPLDDKLSANLRALDALKGLFTGKRRRELEEEHTSLETERIPFARGLKKAEAAIEECDRDIKKSEDAIRGADEVCDREGYSALVYEAAGAYRAAGFLYKAAYLYYRIPNYKDVKDILESDDLNRAVEAKAAYKERYEEGKTVTFGRYRQDQATESPKPIEWIVLENNGESAILISKYALDCQRYNLRFDSVTWETCTLRIWLNEEFLRSAFTEEEQEMLLNTFVTVDKTARYRRISESDTRDRVWLLSTPEAKRYYQSDEARRCRPSEYTVLQGAEIKDGTRANRYKSCSWWLRTSGDHHYNTAFVNADGSIIDTGDSVHSDGIAVRPVIRVALD